MRSEENLYAAGVDLAERPVDRGVEGFGLPVGDNNVDSNRRNFLQLMGLAVLGVFLDDMGYSSQESLKKLRKAELFPGREWAIFANIAAFEGMGVEFMKSDAAKELFDENRKEIDILYPAAGIHLAVLALVREIAAKAVILEKVTLTCTDINPICYKEIDKHLKVIVDKTPCFSDFKVEEVLFGENNEQSPKCKTVTFTYERPDNTKVQVNIVYDYRRTGKDYFSPEHLKKAEILVSHDMVDGKNSPYQALLKIMEGYKRLESPGHDRYLLIAYQKTRISGMLGRNIMFDKIGEEVAVVANKYGCGENHRAVRPKETSHYDSAVMVRLNSKLLKLLADNMSDKELGALVELLNLAQIKEYPNLESIPDESKAYVEAARKRSMEAIHVLNGYLETSHNPHINEIVTDIIISFLNERFFYEPFTEVPGLRQKLLQYVNKHPEAVDIADYNSEVEIKKHMSFDKTREGIPKVMLRRNRLLVMLELARKDDNSEEAEHLRGKLKDLIDKEIDAWLNSPDLRRVLNVFIRDKKVVLGTTKNGLIGEIPYNKANQAEVAFSDKYFYAMKHQFARDHGFLKSVRMNLLGDIFEYFLLLLKAARELESNNYDKICGFVNQLQQRPDDKTYAAKVYELCNSSAVSR